MWGSTFCWNELISTKQVFETIMILFNRLYAIDAYKCHGCAWALLQWWSLSNKLCILSVVRVGHPLVIWGFIWKPSRGGRREHEKPCQLSIDSIAKVTYWPCFLLNAYEERHKTSYRSTADLKLYTYQDSSVATSHCQREKPKMIHTVSTIRVPLKGGSVCFTNTCLSS